MKAARLHAARDLRLHDEPLPVPGPGEQLVRVEAVGICGSDLHSYEEGAIGGVAFTRPTVPCHEMAGRTEDGRLVAIEPAIACGECALCRDGHPNLCPTVRFSGFGRDDGALRQWMAWPSHCLFPLPDGLTAGDGAMLEPFGVALHTVDVAHVRAGASVAVFGSGPIGLFALQAARLAGARALFATDLATRPHRLEAARALGARVFEADGDEGGEVAAAAGSFGVDVAIEAAGTQAALDAAVAAVRPGGRVAIAGIPSEERTSFVAAVARRKGLTLSLVRRMKHTYPRAIGLAAEGRVDLRSVVSHRFPLAEARQAFELSARRDGLKVIVEP